MKSNDDRPVDLASLRAQLEAHHREGRRQTAFDNLRAAPDYGREIPPRLNPDIPDMVDQVTACYVELTQSILGFQDEIVALVDAGKLDPDKSTGLVEHYRHLQAAVDAASAEVVKWHPIAGDGYTGSRGRVPADVHRLADHAKYVYAVGTRDIAALQYRLSELAGTGRLDPGAHKWLQWNHCLPIWETLYSGTLCAVRDERTWDGGWDWSGNTYSDGRQVMAQARVKDWLELERRWPYREGMCGDC